MAVVLKAVKREVSAVTMAIGLAGKFMASGNQRSSTCPYTLYRHTPDRLSVVETASMTVSLLYEILSILLVGGLLSTMFNHVDVAIGSSLSNVIQARLDIMVLSWSGLFLLIMKSTSPVPPMERNPNESAVVGSRVIGSSEEKVHVAIAKDESI